MEKRGLGKNGPQISVLCFGGAPIGGEIGPVGRNKAIDTVKTAIDVGITSIDTAESYGESEHIIGKAIRGYDREKLFLATKVSNDYSPKHINLAVENSLRALNTDYIDLYQLHEPLDSWPIEQTIHQLVELQSKGIIKHIGVSNFSKDQTIEAEKHGPIVSSQPIYNMLFRDAEDLLFPHCIENEIGVLAYSVLGQGLLTGRYKPGHKFADDDSRSKFAAFRGADFEHIFKVTEQLKQWALERGHELQQLAIAWAIAHPAVTTCLVGAKTPEQVYNNIQSVNWKLTKTDLEEIDAIQKGLRLHGDMVSRMTKITDI